MHLSFLSLWDIYNSIWFLLFFFVIISHHLQLIASSHDFHMGTTYHNTWTNLTFYQGELTLEINGKNQSAKRNGGWYILYIYRGEIHTGKKIGRLSIIQIWC